MDGEKTVQAIIRDHLACISSVDSVRPNKDTTIDKALIKLIIKDIRGGNTGRRICYFDEEENKIFNGIQFRGETKS